jgi:hypothetical protein
MFQRVIDDLKDSTGATLRMTSLVALAGLALFITLSFVCAALFVFVMQRFGAIEACLTIAAIFLLISLTIGGIYGSKKKRARERAIAAAERAKRAAANAAPTFDPMLLATALPIVKAVGLTRLIPILAIAGTAYGYYMSRTAAPADDKASDGEDSAV